MTPLLEPTRTRQRDSSRRERGSETVVGTPVRNVRCTRSQAPTADCPNDPNDVSAEEMPPTSNADGRLPEQPERRSENEPPKCAESGTPGRLPKQRESPRDNEPLNSEKPSIDSRQPKPPECRSDHVLPRREKSETDGRLPRRRECRRKHEHPKREKPSTDSRPPERPECQSDNEHTGQLLSPER